MEDWEKRQINENLEELIKLTTCNTSVMAYLTGKGVLSEHDCDTLSAIKIERDRSCKLYKILLTRVGGYTELHCVLNKQKQSGAYMILERGISEHGLPGISNRISYSNQTSASDEYCNPKWALRYYEGTFGGRVVDVKEVNIKLEGIAAVLNEVNLLLKCDSHENIVRYLTVERRGKSAIIAFEPCAITLQEWIEEPEKSAYSSAEFLRQATDGVAHLHFLQIIHGNLNPQNVMLCQITEQTFRVKLADFRTGKSLNEADTLGNDNTILYMYHNTGWMAPEILQIIDLDSGFNILSPGTHRKIRAKLTYASDVFSLGLMYAFVLSDGNHPFGNHAICRPHNILNKNVSVIQSELVQSMLAYDPIDRPPASEILGGNTVLE